MAMSVNDKTRYKNDFNKENYERVVLYLRPEVKQRWQNAASDRGMSLSAYVKGCVEKEGKE